MRTPSLARLIVALSAIIAFPFAACAGINHVISISMDGLRGDFLQTFIDTDPVTFSNFKRLRDRSAFTYNARTDYSQTETIPDHLCMFTGRTVQTTGGFVLASVHGYTNNNPPTADTVHVYGASSGINSGPYKASIFDMVHDRGLSTALYLGKTRLSICERSWNATNGALDVTGADNGRNKLDFVTVVEAQNTNGATTTGFVNDLVAKISAGTLKNYTHIHIADVDYAGHSNSWTTTVGSGYRNAAILANGWIGQILNAIDGNAALNGKVAILLTADHGGGTPSTHHNAAGLNATNYTIPFFLSAPGITPGSDLYSWFENRYNPNATQPLENAAVPPSQPVRNGDLGNLAATLVGVPFITGSTLQPELKKPMVVASNAPGSYSVNWPVYLTGWTLESCDNLAAVPQVWTQVTSGITENGGTRTHIVADPAPSTRFFRLRSPQ